MSILGGYVEKNLVNLILPTYCQTEIPSSLNSFQEENCVIQAMTYERSSFHSTGVLIYSFFKMMKLHSHCKGCKCSMYNKFVKFLVV